MQAYQQLHIFRQADGVLECWQQGSCRQPHICHRVHQQQHGHPQEVLLEEARAEAWQQRRAQLQQRDPQHTALVSQDPGEMDGGWIATEGATAQQDYMQSSNH
jgi:hypothetical protein